MAQPEYKIMKDYVEINQYEWVSRILERSLAGQVCNATYNFGI